MFSKATLLSALAVAAQGTYIPCPNPEPICQQIGSYLPIFPTASSIANALCSKFLNIQVSTITASTTVTNQITSVVNAASKTTVTVSPTLTATVSITSSLSTFSIATATVVPTVNVVTQITSVVKGVSTSTITSTPTSYVSTQTCFLSSTVAPFHKVKRTADAEAAANWGGGGGGGSGWGGDDGGWGGGDGGSNLPSGTDAYSSACSCFGVIFHPSTTVTSTATTVLAAVTSTAYTSTITSTVSKATTLTATKVVALVTVYTSTSTSTVSAPTTVTQTSVIATTTVFTATGVSTVTAAAVSTTLSSLLPSTTYVSGNDSSVFLDFNGYDFYGNDLYGGSCPTPSAKSRLRKRTDDVIYTPVGNYSCNSFSDCQDACAEYNDALVAQAATGQKCAGVTYHSNSYCYMKYSVPGDGVDPCNVIPKSTEQSAILIQQD